MTGTNGGDEEDAGASDVAGFRCGFVGLAGRPNAGKSTLLNRIAGRRLAITSPHPQTTRRTIRGVANGPGHQIVLVDTPGLHRPRTLLGQRLNATARGAWTESDLVCWCLAADEAAGSGDRHMAASLRRVTVEVIVVITKIDIAVPAQVANRLASAEMLSNRAGLTPSAYVPVSAETGENVDVLLGEIVEHLPVSAGMFPATDVTDQAEADLVAELVRQAALIGVRDEMPHSIAVTVEEIRPRTDRTADRPMHDVYATIHVERDSQKAIVIGRRGKRLRDTGTRARKDVERLLGVPVFLDLHVRVAKEWQRDARQLDRWGL